MIDRKDERTRLRRRDRAIRENEEIARLLQASAYGFLATSHQDQPYLHPNLFWYDAENHRIYFHTALEGRTRSNIKANPRVCFGVASMGRLLPADEALEFSVEYESVIAFGRGRVVSEESEGRRALQGLLDKYFPDLRPGEDYRPITQSEWEQTAVFAIEVESWSGKRNPAKS